MMDLDNLKYGEAVKIWSLELDGKPQTFRIEHQFWTGEKKCYVNDELIKEIKGGILQSASFTNDVPFNIGTHQGMFKFRAIGRVIFFDLVVDGNKIEGKEKRALRLPLWFIALLFLALIALALLSAK